MTHQAGRLVCAGLLAFGLACLLRCPQNSNQPFAERLTSNSRNLSHSNLTGQVKNEGLDRAENEGVGLARK